MSEMGQNSRFGPNAEAVLSFADAVKALSSDEWAAVFAAHKARDVGLYGAAIDQLAKAPLTQRSAIEKLCFALADAPEVRTAVDGFGRLERAAVTSIVPLAMKAIAFPDKLGEAEWQAVTAPFVAGGIDCAALAGRS